MVCCSRITDRLGHVFAKANETQKDLRFIAEHLIKCKVLVLFLCLSIGLAIYPPNLLVAQTTSSPDDQLQFNRDIRPILSDRCFACHGPDNETREGGLRLDTQDGIQDSIDLEDPGESELLLRIHSDDDDRMPPPDSKLSLTKKEKQLIERWIKQGAKWDQHWAFVPPKKVAIPKTKNSKWPVNFIDSFILARLEKENLAPASKAAKEKLLRRVSFDLTGLPPTIKQLDEFLNDQSETAYEKAVDRLLQSKSYGERMASDWLDVARYSDTYGYQVDRDRFVWPWRDWVVKSFNKNAPYNQFLTEQLAGDLLPNPTDQQILATTFNRLHPQKVEGGSVEEEFRVEYVADRSHTFGTAFMGLTLECARCHDHKFDPISQKEYYQLFSFFNNIDEAGLYSFFDGGAVPTPKLLLTDNRAKQRIAELRKQITSLETDIPRYIHTQAEPKTRKWLKDSKNRQLATNGNDGSAFVADFQKTSRGNNQLVADPKNGKVLRFTGDDEVKFDAGNFRRHQPFSIAIKIKIPDNEKLLKRSVIFHRSRAWTDSASRGYQLLLKDDRLSASLIHFWPGDAISVRTKARVPTEKWLHVAMVYDGSRRAKGIQLFINGKPAAVEIVRDSLQKTIVGSGTNRLVLGARFRDVGFKNGLVADLRVFSRQLSTVEVAQLHDKTAFSKLMETRESKNEAEFAKLVDYFLLNHDPDFKKKLEQIASSRHQLDKFVDRQNEIMVMREMPKPRPTFVLNRGLYDSPGETVKAKVPAIFPALPTGQKANRLGLARWLTSPKHPLTARVAVNHYWQLCFGHGLVRTPEDFGSQGAQPTHPELLDYLAVDFQQHGWDVKRLLKMIVLSNTYRQSTAATSALLKRDPENKLLARAPTYRLPAEMIRDNVLATSGLLVSKIGGPPARPYELAASFKPSKPDNGAGLYRRSLYTYWKRTGPAPVMLTLDAAKRDVCQMRRERTLSPLAALVQLNNPQTVEASGALAQKLLSKHGDKQKQIVVDLFRSLTSRKPNEKEIAIITKLYKKQRQYFQKNKQAAQAFLKVGKLQIKTDQPIELAAWATVVNTMYNFDECVMKR